jgi:hypothetical protein
MGYRALSQLYIGAACTACCVEVTARRTIPPAHRHALLGIHRGQDVHERAQDSSGRVGTELVAL